MTVEIVLIVAVAANGVIGDGHEIPWRLPSDLARFRALTMGRPLLMGRRTHEAIGRPLPGRRTIVVSRTRDLSGTGVETAATPEAALARGREIAGETGVGEVFVAGGAALYRALLPSVDRIEWTAVEAEPRGDVLFPPIDWTHFALVSESVPAPVPRDEVPFRFLTYRRRPGGATETQPFGRPGSIEG